MDTSLVAAPSIMGDMYKNSSIVDTVMLQKYGDVNVSIETDMTQGGANVTRGEILNLSGAIVLQAYKISQMYIVPVVIIIGLVGNFLSFAVFMFSFLRRLSSSVYLAALSLADFCFLFCAGISWLNMVRVRWYHQPGWCQIFVFMTYVWSFLSVWFTVGFTVERYIAVCIPLKRQEMCTKRRARIVVILLTVFALVFYSSALWTSGSIVMGRHKRRYCMTYEPYYEYMNILNHVDTVITLLLPVVTIVILNIQIMRKVFIFYKHHKNNTYSPYNGRNVKGSRNVGSYTAAVRVRLGEAKTLSGSSSSERITKPEPRQLAPDKVLGDNMFSCTASGVTFGKVSRVDQPACRTTLSQIRVTKMLVLVSSAFVVLNFPSHVMRIYGFYIFVHKDTHYSRTFVSLSHLFEHLYYINFACNVFLYSLSGRNFRKACRQLWKKLCYRIGRFCASAWKDRLVHKRRYSSCARRSVMAMSTRSKVSRI